MALRPVRSAASFTTAMTRVTRSAKGQCAPSAWSSSSLMKSMPPSTSAFTCSAVCSGLSPTLGLTMVPTIGPRGTPASRRVPATPKAGPG